MRGGATRYGAVRFQSVKIFQVCRKVGDVPCQATTRCLCCCRRLQSAASLTGSALPFREAKQGRAGKVEGLLALPADACARTIHNALLGPIQLDSTRLRPEMGTTKVRSGTTHDDPARISCRDLFIAYRFQCVLY